MQVDDICKGKQNLTENSPGGGGGGASYVFKVMAIKIMQLIVIRKQLIIDNNY